MNARLDSAMTAQGLCASRSEAQRMILSGGVYVNGRKETRPGAQVKATDAIEVRGKKEPFVSRGGRKLEKAFDAFQLRCEGLTALDIGASAGGFTDCLLQHGAAKVYALDVGYGQLDWRLRNDARVVVRERTNARFMEPDWFDERIQCAVMDVSFISIKHILPPLRACLADEAWVVTLVKPQFEAGRGSVGKKGVVKDPGVHVQVLENALDAAKGAGYAAVGLDFSPITGPEGNIEFLLHLLCEGESAPLDAKDVVHRAHAFFTR